MWEDMHETIQEKERQIAELNATRDTGASEEKERTGIYAEALPKRIQSLEDQIQGLKLRNQDLEQLLREARAEKGQGHSAKETHSGDDEDDLEEALQQAFASSDDGKVLSSITPAATEAIKEEHISIGDYSSGHSNPLTRVSHTMACPSSLSAITPSGPPTAASLPDGHTFIPLIRFPGDDNWDCGDFSQLHADVKASVYGLFETTNQQCADETQIGQRRRLLPRKQIEMKACLWIFIKKGSAAWTEDHPRRLACKECFNGSCACILWLGSGSWIVLPIAAQIRDPGASWQDVGFYIHEGDGIASDWTDVWALTDAQSKKRERIMASLTEEANVAPPLGSLRKVEEVAEDVEEEMSAAE